MTKKKKVILLGGAGKVGQGVIQEYIRNYRKSYDLIVGYHRKKPEAAGLKSVKVDLGNCKVLKKAFRGVDVVVNLAANPKPAARFEDLVKPNLVGAYNVFEAARHAKCYRVIYASSVHTIKGYPHGVAVRGSKAPMPLNFYGATKVFGEALCNVFSSKFGLSCLAIRIGAYVSDDEKKIVCDTRTDYDYVISQKDMGQLIHKCIMAKKGLKFGIFSGISDNRHKRMELDYTRRVLGYKPEDDAFDTCKAIKKGRLR